MSSQPVSFSFEPTIEGEHVRVVVRCGPEGGRGLCGELVMRTGEWSLLRWLLATTPPLESNEAYIPRWARGQSAVMFHTPISEEPIVVQPDQWPAIVGARFDAARDALEASKAVLAELQRDGEDAGAAAAAGPSPSGA